MHRVIITFGTRPEAIKMASIIRAFTASLKVRVRIVVTGQHREMLDQVLGDFGIKPDIDLNLMQKNQSLTALTSHALQGLDSVYEREDPDLVLVQGDTTTSFCAALAAFYHNIPVGHVEAGLRTHDFRAPWPEESNRVLTTQLADLHFAPTEQSRQNLLAEGVSANDIFVTGNTAIDALLMARGILAHKPVDIPGLSGNLFDGQRLVLITGHRRESFGSGFRSICEAVGRLAALYPSVHFVYPVHLNPKVLQPVTEFLGKNRFRNVHLIAPLTYLQFVRLMQSAYLILTDSGGIQEEAPSLGKPVFVMRETTERPEAVEAGACRLVGTNAESILTEVSRALDDEAYYTQMAQVRNIFGDGESGARIHRACVEFLETCNDVTTAISGRHLGLSHTELPCEKSR